MTRSNDPNAANVDGYVTPSEAELKARNSRNLSIALSLLGFIVFVFFLTIYQFSKTGKLPGV